MSLSAFLLSIACVAALGTASSEDVFLESKQAYATLRADKVRRTQRHPYERIITRLLDASRDGAPRADDCVFFAATVAEDLHHESGVAADLDRAVQLNIQVADKHRNSSLADDALWRAAKLLASKKGDLNGARKMLVRAREAYPRGDQAAAIRELMERLPASVESHASRSNARASSSRDARAVGSRDPGGDRIQAILARYAQEARDAGVVESDAGTSNAVVVAAPNPPPQPPSATQAPAPLKSFRSRTNPQRSELSLGVEGAVTLGSGTVPASGKLPYRFFVDIAPALLGKVGRDLKSYKDDHVLRARAAQYDARTVRVVFELKEAMPASAMVDAAGNRVVVTLGEAPVPSPATLSTGDTPDGGVRLSAAEEEDPKPAARADSTAVDDGTPEADGESAPDVRTAATTPPVPPAPVAAPSVPSPGAAELPAQDGAKGTQDVVEAVAAAVDEEDRALEDMKALASEMAARPSISISAQTGLKVRRVVIDPGHGGHDPGAIGPTGVKEKDITLQIAKKVAAKLRKDLKMEVTLTRDKDVFIPLEERTALANRLRADLFISIHVNSNPNRRIHGVETYYLNITDDSYSMRLAARENKYSQRSINDLQFILADLAMKSNVDDSARLSKLVQSNMSRELRESYSNVKDLGVKHALFYVLIGAKMPAILVETSFISNKMEEQRLVNSRYQDTVADGLVQGVRNFVEERQALAR